MVSNAFLSSTNRSRSVIARTVFYLAIFFMRPNSPKNVPVDLADNNIMSDYIYFKELSNSLQVRGKSLITLSSFFKFKYISIRLLYFIKNKFFCMDYINSLNLIFNEVLSVISSTNIFAYYPFKQIYIL